MIIAEPYCSRLRATGRIGFRKSDRLDDDIMEDGLRRRCLQYKPRDYSTISEQEVLNDIRRFREQLAMLARTDHRHAQAHAEARRQVYRTLLRQRRQLLAAIRAGQPRDWPVFTAA